MQHKRSESKRCNQTRTNNTIQFGQTVYQASAASSMPRQDCLCTDKQQFMLFLPKYELKSVATAPDSLASKLSSKLNSSVLSERQRADYTFM